MKEFLDMKLSNLRNKNLLRDTMDIESPQGSRVMIDNKEYILLGSNSYLDLSENENIKSRVKSAIDKYGLGAGGSRLTTGNYDLNRVLEETIAELKQTEACLTFSTGYMANVGVISALCDRKWVIFSDKLNHASIVDGCMLSGAKLVRYKHCDMEDLESKLSQYSGTYNLIVTDAIFSMDGDIAPLKEIPKIAKSYGAYTMVDDAHGFGVLGKNGAGTADALGVSKDIDIHIGTLSKAIPSMGGFVAGSKLLIDYIKNIARSFIFTTGLTPINAATALYAIEEMKELDDDREHLLELSKWVKDRLIQEGFKVPNTQTPIIPIVIGKAKDCIELKNGLLEDGIYVNAIRPPTVPKNTSRLRLSLMCSHSYEDLEFVIERLIYHAKSLDILGDKV